MKHCIKYIREYSEGTHEGDFKNDKQEGKGRFFYILLSFKIKMNGKMGKK